MNCLAAPHVLFPGIAAIMSDEIYDQLEQARRSGDVDATLNQLAAHLRTNHQYHDLFDVRLMQARAKHGLPLIWTKSLDQLPEPQRTAVEDASIEACREVGNAMLEVGRVREAWMYLRPTGDKNELAARLEQLVKEDESLSEDVIEIALNEGLAPRLGFELMLNSYGLCNAITTFDQQMHGKPKDQRREVVQLLVKFIHNELLHAHASTRSAPPRSCTRSICAWTTSTTAISSIRRSSSPTRRAPCAASWSTSRGADSS